MSKIEWTDKTWNPVIGCSPISPGCDHCYARAMSQRFAYFRSVKNWDGTVSYMRGKMAEPQTWRKPQMVFVCSMGDLFHESVPFEWIDAVFTVMSDCDQHIYQVLTKRPQRVLDFFSWKWEQTHTHMNYVLPWFPKPNVWFGVTAENQKQWEIRVPLLLKIPSAVIFVSCEPLLSHIDMELPDQIDKRISWLILGSETGSQARPMDMSWATWLAVQCSNRDIPLFTKNLYQFGKKIQYDDLPDLLRKREYPKMFKDQLI